MNDFEQWEHEVDAARWTPPMVAALHLGGQWQASQPAPEAPAQIEHRITDIWRVQYHQGRYWHINVKRDAGHKYPGMNHTMRGAFVCAPLEIGYSYRGGVPLAWYGPRLAAIQTLTWDKA